MANKDPAFLFYSSDFLTGTMLMKDEQKGRYITLLCLQHQKGHLTKEDMLKVCITQDKDIFSKFEQLPDGSYHNIRLHNEIIKRRAFCDSRRNNRLHKSNICKTSVGHMEDVNEDEDINRDKKKIDKVKYAEFVYMKPEQYQKLVNEHGERAAKRMVEILDNYKGSKGKTYKDDYRAILNWVVGRFKEELTKAPAKQGKEPLVYHSPKGIPENIKAILAAREL